MGIANNQFQINIPSSTLQVSPMHIPGGNKQYTHQQDGYTKDQGACIPIDNDEYGHFCDRRNAKNNASYQPVKPYDHIANDIACKHTKNS